MCETGSDKKEKNSKQAQGYLRYKGNTCKPEYKETMLLLQYCKLIREHNRNMEK